MIYLFQINYMNFVKKKFFNNNLLTIVFVMLDFQDYNFIIENCDKKYY